MLNKTPFTDKCDSLMAFFFYATIFFLPIAPAIIETLFGFIMLTYVIKRAYIFFSNMSDKNKGLNNRYELFKRSFSPVESPLKRSVSIFVFIGFLTILISNYPAVSFKAFFSKLLQAAFFYYLFGECINTKKRLNIFTGMFLLSATLVISDGASQYFSGIEFVHFNPIRDGRVTSCIDHANELGSYLVCVIPIISFLALQKKVFQKNGFFHSSLFRIFMGVLAIIGLIVLGLTYSRGAWVAFAGSLFFIGLRKPKLLVLFMLLIALFGSVFVPRMMKERETNITMGGMFTTSDRFRYWGTAVDIIKTKPILGTGLNTYDRVAKYMKVDYPIYPHNGYLHMTAEMGIIGIISFLSILFMLFKKGFSVLKHINDEFYRNLLLGAMAGFFGFLISAFFDTTFYNTQLSALLWLMIGFISSLQKQS